MRSFLRSIFDNLRQWEHIELYLLVVAGVILAILNLLGIAPANLTNSVSLAVLALLVGAMLGIRHRLEGIHNKLSQQHIEVVNFEDGEAFLSYFRSRIRSAKRVDDINWREQYPATSSGEQKIVQKLDQEFLSLLHKPDMTWREIVIFANKHRFERVRKLLSENIAGYSVAYYETGSSIPRITFAIIDGEEVLLASENARLSIRHPAVVEYFEEYYDTLWREGNWLKSGRSVNERELTKFVDGWESRLS